jgi:hypothetical protein
VRRVSRGCEEGVRRVRGGSEEGVHQRPSTLTSSGTLRRSRVDSKTNESPLSKNTIFPYGAPRCTENQKGDKFHSKGYLAHKDGPGPGFRYKSSNSFGVYPSRSKTDFEPHNLHQEVDREP